MNALRFVFTLFDRMSGPARRIRDNLAGVRRELGRTRVAFNQFYSSTSGIRTLAAGTGAAIVGMTTIAAAGFAALAIQSASFKEQAETSFQVLLKNKAAGTQLYNQAVRFAAITPFDTKGVIADYQQLLGFGFKPIELPVVLSGIGDLASIKGFSQESVNKIILAMGQIRAKGRLLGNEMMQLTEAGFSQATFYQIVSKKLGVSVNQVRKLQEAGKLDSGTALGGILETIRQTVSGGKLGNLMKRQSENLQGLWSTLASRPFEMLQNFDKAGAFKDLKTVIKNLGDAFDTATPKGQAMSKALISLADTIVGGVFGPLKDVTSAEKIGNTVNKITAWVKRFQIFWRQAWPQAIALFKGFIQGVQAGWKIIVQAYQAAKPVINFISAFVAKLTGAKEGAGSTAEKIGRLAGLFTVLAIAAGGLSMLLVPIRLLLGLADALGMVFRMGRGTWKALGEGVKLFKAFRQWGGLTRLLTPVGTAIRGIGIAALNLGRGFLVAIGPVGWVILAITALVGVAVWAYNRFDWFKKAVDTVWRGIVLGAKTVWEGVKGWFLLLWGWISGDTKAQEAGTKLIQKFNAAIFAAWQVVKTWAVKAGGELLEGIKQGITDKALALQNKVTSTADSVGQWFRDRLGIHSPSRVFAGYGNNIMEGLVNGISAGKSLLSSTIQGVTGFLSEMWLRHRPSFALSPVMGGLAGGGGGTGGGGASGLFGGLPSALVGKSNNTIANAAMKGLTEGWAESLPGYCSRFVRQVFTKAVGPATNRLFGSSAIQTERNFKAAGLSKTLAQIGGLGGLKAGDVLFQGFGSGGFGHTGIYVGNGMVAQNTTAAGGGKRLLPVSAFGGITSVGRLPETAPIRQPAPSAPRRGGNTINVTPVIHVPPGTPEQQSKKLKADAKAAGFQGTALALEQLALQNGHN